MRAGSLALTLFTLIPSWTLAAVLPYRHSLDVRKSSMATRKAVLPMRRSSGVGERRRKSTRDNQDLTGAAGLGDVGDLLYSVSLNIGGVETALHVDTGSSDLWVISDACKSGRCSGADGPPVRTASLDLTGADVTMQYGDSTTGTSASGPIARADVTLAGITLAQQPFGAINFTDNGVVGPGVPTAGIFGLGFPSGSSVQANVLKAQGSFTVDQFLGATSTLGPILSRLAMEGDIEQPLFAVTLQRNTIDIGGNEGSLTVGDLPNGVDSSSLTWVPVRLYPSDVGGLHPPSSAPNEVYPLRWEVIIDGVYLNGKKLDDTQLAGEGPISALVDTGNSLLRGPSDVVQTIFQTISPESSSNSANGPTIACTTPNTLSFQIGGKMFPVDARDLIGVQSPGNAQTCIFDKLVSTDPPSKSGRLFSWSLGDPFLKSNLVAFYFGNLTHPSVDPPRIGFLSTVPEDAHEQLKDAVKDAVKNGGHFETTIEAAPTGTLASSVIVVSTIPIAQTSTTSIVQTPIALTSSAPALSTSETVSESSTNKPQATAIIQIAASGTLTESITDSPGISAIKTSSVITSASTHASSLNTSPSLFLTDSAAATAKVSAPSNSLSASMEASSFASVNQAQNSAHRRIPMSFMFNCIVGFTFVSVTLGWSFVW